MLRRMEKLDALPLSSNARIATRGTPCASSAAEPSGATAPAAISAICVPCPTGSSSERSGLSASNLPTTRSPNSAAAPSPESRIAIGGAPDGGDEGASSRPAAAAARTVPGGISAT